MLFLSIFETSDKRKKKKKKRVKSNVVFEHFWLLAEK